MDWFKRYGIPGAYCMGLTLVWLVILYPCRVDLSDEKTVKLIAVIFGGGFLPFGYLMYLVGQGWYFFRCCLSSGYGGHARARHIAEINRENYAALNSPVDIDDWAKWAVRGIQEAINNFILWLLIPRISKLNQEHLDTLARKETVLSACSVLHAVSSNWSEFEKGEEQFVQEWIRKRNDIVVMNQTIMAGTIVCPIGVLFLDLLSGWSLQPYEHKDWIWFLAAVVLLSLIILYVTSVVRTGIDIVIAGGFNLRHRFNGRRNAGANNGEVRTEEASVGEGTEEASGGESTGATSGTEL